MRLVYLIPHRALTEQSQWNELNALSDEHEVIPIFAPKPGAAGIIWLSTIGAREAIRQRPDAIVARDLDALGGAWKVKRATGAKLVYDMHDPYSMMVEGDVPAAIGRLADFRERRLLRRVDLALASDSGRMNWLRSQGYAGPGEIVLNCRDPLSYRPPDDLNRLCYAGTLHRTRFIREMIDAMFFLHKAQLVLAGPRTPNSEYDWLKGRYGVSEYETFKGPIVFLGELGWEQALMLVKNSDVSIQMGDPSIRINALGPYSRLFDAMSVGRAAIGTWGTANGALIETVRMGLACRYNVPSFVDAIARLLTEDSGAKRKRSENAYGACVSQFNWKKQTEKLLGAFGWL